MGLNANDEDFNKAMFAYKFHEELADFFSSWVLAFFEELPEQLNSLIRPRRLFFTQKPKEEILMKSLTPLWAIRRKCLDCVSTPKMVRQCEEGNCPLYPYRFGKDPRRKGVGRMGGNPEIAGLSKKRYRPSPKIRFFAKNSLTQLVVSEKKNSTHGGERV